MKKPRVGYSEKKVETEIENTIILHSKQSNYNKTRLKAHENKE